MSQCLKYIFLVLIFLGCGCLNGHISGSFIFFPYGILLKGPRKKPEVTMLNCNYTELNMTDTMALCNLTVACQKWRRHHISTVWFKKVKIVRLYEMMTVQDASWARSSHKRNLVRLTLSYEVRHCGPWMLYRPIRGHQDILPPHVLLCTRIRRVI